jgi:N-acetylneuraminic acid mutarotase
MLPLYFHPHSIGTPRDSLGKTGLKKTCAVCLALLFSFVEVQAQNGVWTRRSDMPTGRAAHETVVVGNKIYVLGGFNANLVEFDANEVYDPSADTWETKAPLPAPRALLAAAVVNDTIYAFGGGYPDPTNEVYAYDPVSDTWTRKSDMPRARTRASAGVIDGIVYIVGGNRTERNCEAYDPATDTWTRKKDIPGGTSGSISLAPYGGLLYAFGGGYTMVFSPTYSYDPRTDRWTRKAEMPTARAWEHAAPVIDGKMYLIGGFTSADYGTLLSDVDVYDPESDRWTEMPDMPFRKGLIGAAVVNGKIYVIGGTLDWTDSGSNEVWEYDPAVATGVAHSAELPVEVVLEQNYPNPFNPMTTISYTLPRFSEVTLTIHDTLGRQVSVLASGVQPAGSHEVSFDATGLPSGVYLYRLQAGEYAMAKRMMVVK